MLFASLLSQTRVSVEKETLRTRENVYLSIERLMQWFDPLSPFLPHSKTDTCREWGSTSGTFFSCAVPAILSTSCGRKALAWY